MGIVQMNNNVLEANGMVELNKHTQYGSNQIKDGATGEGQGFSEEDESRINEDVEDINNGKKRAEQVQTHVQQRQQHQPAGPLVRWERFLPLRSLKILLVENDDSTRHLVCALLRNCGYEVTAVSNGLQAWKILEDLINHFDLVLTEVVMPYLSGIGLLSKIMSHKTCKNIPVIMMSSRDSMNIVFKCLSKGAVDFLVKPIRKNELKNLWQHVWRKCHSSSGSGSESGIRTQKSTKSKSAEDSDNNTGSNDEDDIRSVGLNILDGSDNGSGTQSSWTKRAVEVDSPRPTSPCAQVADPPDSTCAQVIHSKTEAFGNSQLPFTVAEGDVQDSEPENIAMGKDLEIGVPKATKLQFSFLDKKILMNMGNTSKENLSEINKKDDNQQERGKLELNKSMRDLRNQPADVIGAITNNTDGQIETAAFGIPNGLSNVSEKNDKVIYDNKNRPSLELSLKRIRDVEDTGTSIHERNVLRHSDFSAFSRYNSNSTATQAPTGNVGSCSPHDNSSEAAKTDSMKNIQSNSNGMPVKQRSHGSSNNNDMGSTTNNAFTKSTVFSDEPTPKTSVKPFHPSSAFQRVHNGCVSVSQPVQAKGNTATEKMTLVQSRGVDQKMQVQHHHHHYHHHHHHIHNITKNQQVDKHNDSFLEDMASVTPQCGSSNLPSAPHLEVNPGNHNMNGSTSGSYHGSNGQDGGCTALNTTGLKITGEDVGPGKVGDSGGIGSRGSGFEQNCLTQREAALYKFRQKRKDRCFEKKVRYQSRKKLAEQRPRVRGQFVRQVHKNHDRNTHQ